MLRIRSIALLVLFIAAVLLTVLLRLQCGGRLHALSEAGRQTVLLVRVSDGDTLLVADERGRELKVRLAGIDTPELGSADGFRAALYSAELLEGAKRIELESEPAQLTREDAPGPLLDRYGRLLGWVWVTGSDGRELLLQEELLREGLGELYTAEPHGKLYYERLLRAARRN